MEKIKEDIEFNNLKDELKYITLLILSQSHEFKKMTRYKEIIEEKEEEILKFDKDLDYFEILPYPLFKIKDVPLEKRANDWFKEKDKNSLKIPTFVGKFKELIYKVKPQMILEDSEGNEINIILNLDEDFDYIQQWMLDLKYEIEKYVFVYDAFKIEVGEKQYCIVVDSFERMSNENWINRLKPRRGISAKYLPKIIFTLFLLWICYIYDLK